MQELLGQLIARYMQQYGCTWEEAIECIKVDLRLIPEPVVLSGHFGT